MAAKSSETDKESHCRLSHMKASLSEGSASSQPSEFIYKDSSFQKEPTVGRDCQPEQARVGCVLEFNHHILWSFRSPQFLWNVVKVGNHSWAYQFKTTNNYLLHLNRCFIS